MVGQSYKRGCDYKNRLQNEMLNTVKIMKLQYFGDVMRDEKYYVLLRTTADHSVEETG